MNEYTEGICGDGAAILRNGERMTICEVVNALNDYAALEAKHNALREAVAWERECAEFDKWANDNCQGSYEWDNVVYCATLEVDRLIAIDKE